jgi:DNA-binding response OmpR family regulator
VLIVSDDPMSARVWGFSLSQLGLRVRLIGVEEQVIDIWAEEVPDLIVIEDFNDQVEEMQVLQQLRSETIVPILFLTSKTHETFHFQTYEIGADECIPLPITPRLFQAKVKSWLRRSFAMPLIGADEVRAGPFALNTSQKRLILPDGNSIRLTILETRLLYVLMSNDGRSVDGEAIVRQVWGRFSVSDHRLLKNHVYRLRRKLEPDLANPCYLLSEGRNSYRFRARQTSPGEAAGGDL